MKSFRKLSQNKRKKMVILILLLILLPFFKGSDCINLTYIVKKDNNKVVPSCIAEEFERYEAVGWVFPIPSKQENIPNITSKIIPAMDSDFNCKFSKNNICSKRWTIKNWNIDDSSARTKEFIADYRWEDLPSVLISNTSKEFTHRTEISNAFKSGISVRADGEIELLVCSGWNPYDHPCYHFNIDNREIFLNKYSVLPHDLNDTETTYLEHYKANSNILSRGEWRNFIVSFDENKTIRLFDVNLKRTVVEHKDDGSFSPMYLLVRSNEPSLWKFHENEFLYTNTTQVSRLGPLLTIFSKDLCVSLLVSLCDTCEMVFFYQNFKTRKILKEIKPPKDVQWMEIKLKESNIEFQEINLFVETKFTTYETNEKGFWAIDNVRICNENEVKVTYLKLNETEVNNEEEDISCQLIKKPSWRPKKLVYDKIEGFPEIDVKTDSTSIKLSWAEEDTRNEINYFVLYQANDNCTYKPYNLERLKSSGFLTTRYNEIVIENLVPFTMYNVTISTVLHEADKHIYVKTLEMMEPTIEELPQKVQIRPTDSVLYVSWQEVPCTLVYGRLIYGLTVSNERLNFEKTLPFETDVNYMISGLQAFTPYTLNITTARNAASIHRGMHSKSMVYNFTTLPGVAPPVENLELYSIDENSASLRFDLPKNLNGEPIETKLTRCLSFTKCKSYIAPLKRCPLWRKQFCVFVYNLIGFQQYTFRLSLKNRNTATFGREVPVSGYTVNRVPGAPTNVSYKIVDCLMSTDYCHLNLTWSHPYNENGTITTFNIMLSSVNISNRSEDDKYIHDVYRVDNKSYTPKYTYQIKYMPYSATYNLSVQSTNVIHKSNFTRILVKTDNLGDHIDQNPKLINKTENSLLFKIPHLDRRLDFYVLTVVVQDFERKKAIPSKILDNRKVAENLCHDFGNTWISTIIKVEQNKTENITIGNSDKEKIKPKTKYCITFIITNRYRGSEHDVVYHEKLETPDSPLPPTAKVKESSSNTHLYALLLLLLLIPIGFFIYRYLRKRRVIPKPEENKENEYETLPFDECENNFVNNDNYDHLLHK